MSMNGEDLWVVKDSMVPKGESYCFREKKVRVIKSLEIPIDIGGRKVQLITEVLEGDIPWLLGKRTLKKMRALLDIGKGSMRITDLGHVKVPLRESWEDLVLKLREGENRKYVWWKTEHWLENERDRIKYRKRLFAIWTL